MITANRQISTDEVAGHYDELDPFYRRLWSQHVHHGLWQTGDESPQEAVELLIETAIEPLELTAGTQLCDVGCGYGETARYLANKFATSVVGITLSQAQFDRAERENHGEHNPRFVLGNWETNSFKSKSFDAVISIECLAHVPNKPKFFEQIHRVLQPGGRAVVLAWLEGEDYRPWQRRRLLEPICREGRLPSMGNQSDYESMAKQSGLEVIEFKDLTDQVSKTWRICTRRVLVQLLTSPRAWWFLLRQKSSSWVFLFSVWRIRFAYHTGAMRYGMFVLKKGQQ